MIDRELIESIFRKLDLYVNHLRQLAPVSRAKFLDDMTISSAAKYNLHIAVDDSQVYDTINNNLGDFDRFKAAIYKYLQQESS